MRILVLNGAATREDGQSLVALLEQDANHLIHLKAEQFFPAKGAAEHFAVGLQTMLNQCAWHAKDIEVVVCVTGPGSFTGLRASLALAQGIALGTQCRIAGVNLGDIFLPLLQQAYPQHVPLCLFQARHNRLFCLTSHKAKGVGIDQLEEPVTPTIIAGDGILLLKERQISFDHMFFSEWVYPTAVQIAQAGLQKLSSAAGEEEPLAALLPLYIDPPEAKLPAGGLRPAPVSE